jgi:hypothetical protein
MKTILVLTTLLLATGCDYMDVKGAAAPPPSNAGTGGTAPDPTSTATPATFQAVYNQILAPKCLSCHGSGTAPTLSSWAAFAQDTRYVLPGNPGQSDIYVQVSSGNMPKGGAALSQSDLTLLYNWIEQGALNN